MIKRTANIVIVVLVLLATGGIPITWHYCGSKAMSFSVFSTPTPCCDSHCEKCHNVFKFSKVNDDFEVGSYVTTRSMTDIVTLHIAIFIDISDNLQSSSLPDLIYQRKILIAEAGHSPASLCNFRC